MIGTEDMMRTLLCPLLSQATGKQTKCVATSCAWYRYAAAPGVRAKASAAEMSKPVGYCGQLPPPDYQHLAVAVGQHLRNRGTLLNPRFDADGLNTGAEVLAQAPPKPPMPPTFEEIVAEAMAGDPCFPKSAIPVAVDAEF